MERNYFMPTYPETKLDIKQSLGISIFTNIQLLDYYINSSTFQTEWIKEFSHKLPQSVMDDLRILRTLFAHGVILRDFYIKKMTNLSQDWDAFIGWWKGLSEEEVLDLVVYGIKETMDYYDQYLPAMPLVEQTMKEVNLEDNQLKKDAKNREMAIKAVLQSWSVETMDEILPLYNDLTVIKERIVRLVEGIWRSGFREHWESKKSRLSDWKLKNITQLSISFGTNEEAIFKITGLYPDTNEIEKINRAHFLTFIPVPNMGRLLTFFEIDKHVYLMFDPFLDDRNKNPNDLQTAEFHSAFEGLGDPTRLQIIHLLAENREMFAQQIVTQLNMKQSTVSRHLNQLHQANLVNVRQDGNTKYFSINKDEIQKVINILDTFLK